MEKEKAFENRVKKWLKSQGIYSAGTPINDGENVNGWFVKMWGGGFQKAGIPDLIMCVNGIFISVEFKSTMGLASELQKLNTTCINAAQGIGVILYPDGFKEFKRLIEGVIKCKSHIAELTHMRDAHINTGCVILTE